jgi:nitric oxide reductase NorQ protein
LLTPSIEAVDAHDPLKAWRIAHAPYYEPVGDELSWFTHAHRHRLPMLLKGPTGCGKTRFVEHMAHRLGRPLVTIACNEDMGAADLVGRWLLDAQGTVWQDGPLTQAVRHGAICYLDEVAEARPDALVAIHPLTDTRRALPLERKGELLHAHEDFQLVVSYNPGDGGGSLVLKDSTRQRFVAWDFDYPTTEVETQIVAHEARVPQETASQLVAIAQRSRALREQGMEHGISTRMLVRAGTLIEGGMPARQACQTALVAALSDDADVLLALRALVDAHFA